MADTPFISVIIAAGWRDIRPTVESLCEQDYAAERFEIIVVSEEAKLPPELEAGVRHVHARDRNPAYKRNLGAAAARGSLLGFIGDDALAPSHWLTQAAALMCAHSDAAGVGGPNLLPPGAGLGERVSDALVSMPLLGVGSVAYRAKALKRLAKPTDLRLVNMFVRSDVFSQVGGLNEAVGDGGADTEFVFRADQATKQSFLYSSDLFVYHHLRAFGVGHLAQGLRLQANAARVCLAFPGIYVGKVAFWAKVAAPVVLGALLAVRPMWGVGMLGAYGALVAGLTAFARPLLLPLVVLAGPLHHAAQIGGFCWGLLGSALRPMRVRRIRARERISLPAGT